MSSSQGKLIWKVSLLVRSEVLGLLVNTLTADNKYCRYDKMKFPQPIQMQLSEKKIFFLNSLLHFRNLHKISNILKKKDKSHSLSVTEIFTESVMKSKKPVYLNV